MARFTENRWTSAIIPALLIHIPIGTVYCWSVFKQLIADRLNASPASVEDNARILAHFRIPALT